MELHDAILLRREGFSYFRLYPCNLIQLLAESCRFYWRRCRKTRCLDDRRWRGLRCHPRPRRHTISDQSDDGNRQERLREGDRSHPICERCIQTVGDQSVDSFRDALPSSTPETGRRNEQCAEHSSLCGVVNTELDRIKGKPETVGSKSMLGSNEPPQESALFSAKLHRVDVIDALDSQHRADSRSLKLPDTTLVDIDLNGVRCIPEVAAGSAIQRFKESRPI